MTYCSTTYYSSSCRSYDQGASSISGRYSFDEDRNNSELNAYGFDKGIAGKQVYLIDSYGRVVASTTTNADGAYKFAQLKAGYYKIAFEGASGFSFADKDATDGRFDSDANCNGVTDWLSISSCQNVSDIDVSLQRDVGKITGSIFADAGCDGINGGYKTVAGATYVMEAEAMCRSGSLVVASGSQASGGKFVKLNCGSTGTLADCFSGKSGTYDVTLRVQDECDGQSTITLKVNGCTVTAVRLDRDVNGSGGDNGGFSDFVIKGVKIDAGAKIELAVQGSGSEYVRLDKVTFQGAPTTTYVAEAAKAGVKVVLLDGAGAVVASTLTDANGNYTFKDVPTGQYRVMGEAPDGTKFTLKDAGGNDAIDSDVGADGKSDLITVTKDGVYDVDMGLCTIKYGAVEGRYFLDADRNGVDNGEAGVAGKLVTLSKADGTVVATATTDANGHYVFNNVVAGNYVLGFESSAAQAREFTTANVGANDAIDSDADVVTGKTGVVTVVEGQTTADVDVGVRDQLGAVSGRYFFDADRNGVDNGEAGVAGKVVTLYTAAGATVASTTTDANGHYAFTGVIGGAYVVGFESSAAENRAFVAPNLGSNDAIDSDVDAAGRVSVSILPGQTTADVDAGVYRLNKAPVAVADATQTCADEAKTFSLVANDSDPDGTPPAVVALSDEDETIAVGGTLTLASGAKVTLHADGSVTYDGVAAHAGLTIGSTAQDSFSYTLSDGIDTATAGVTVDVCGALNTPETIDARTFGGAKITYIVDAFTPSNAIDAFAFKMVSVSIPDDFATTPRTVADLGGPLFSAAYCIDAHRDIYSNVLTTGDLMVATASNALKAGLSASAADHMDNLNWLLNQHFTSVDNGDGNAKTYTDLEVQEAVYLLMNNDTFFINNSDYGNIFVDNNDGVRQANELGTLQNAHEIAQLALTQGEGFVAGSGDLLGMIIDPTSPAQQEQPFIFALSFDLFAENCLCA
jgi:protocatechuate 3,4-dioxygenase beta subunit